jgi:hypothetical protein
MEIQQKNGGRTGGIVGGKITAFVAEGCCLAMRTLTPSPGGVLNRMKHIKYHYLPLRSILTMSSPSI